MKLLYEEGFGEINSDAVPQYNGNISGMAWLGPWSCDAKGYGYTYDPMNRLTNAYYEEYEYVYHQAYQSTLNDWSANKDAYSTSYTYDKNGNILTLSRRGFNGILYPSGTVEYKDIDLLSYSYQGNRLVSVSDAGTSVINTQDFFTDGSSLSTEYLYDASGNMREDKNRGILASYNHLNKPTEVQKDSSGVIEYIYSADGTKLRQKVILNGSTSKITDYVRAYQYEDVDGEGGVSKSLVHILHSKGRTVPVRGKLDTGILFERSLR